MNKKKSEPDKKVKISLSSKVESVAKFLREEVHDIKPALKKEYRLPSEESPHLALSNTIEQIAKLIRTVSHKKKKK